MPDDIRRKALAIYTAHHGNDARAKDFADEVIDRSEAYDAIRDVMQVRMNRDQRRQHRADLEAIEDTARKLRGLIERTDIRCRFEMRDDRVIGYPEMLDFLRRQAAAERQAMESSQNTGSKRHDIDALVSQLAVAFDLFDVPRERMMPLLELITDASDKTLAAYLSTHRK